MTVEHSPHDAVFFAEWSARAPGAHRSLARAKAVADALGVTHMAVPVLTIVGSKGKGTIAAYASAALHALGVRVGMLTSPALLSNRERLRVDGVPITPDDYGALAARMSDAIARAALAPDDVNYLSPSGLYALAALVYFVEQQCDAVVLEAGMGGASDEVSLVTPTVAAVGPIFGEHLGELADTVAGIARDKLALALRATHGIVMTAQTGDAQTVAISSVASRHDVTVIDDVSPQLAPLLPAGLSARNALVGLEAACRLAAVLGRPADAMALAHALHGRIPLPGRLSTHVDAEGRRWMLDAAVNAEAIREALAECTRRCGGVGTVVLGLPDSKSWDGLSDVLHGCDVRQVSLDTPHLTFTRRLPGAAIDTLDDLWRAPLREPVLAVGTWSFVARVLSGLHVPVDALFRTDEAPVVEHPPLVPPPT